ncbi:MAG: methyltransferase domain-containing protein [Patescibacteria group bacterium]|nr:methyltransferase domain-containing protein [Patescibacteria group bacterium]
MNFYRIFQKLYQRSAYKMCLECEGFIKNKSKILDVGCGSAIIANTFQNFFDTEVIGVDVKDRRIFPIAFSLINGRKLNFPDNSFDNVLIAYTLHHSQDPAALLKEVRRVAKHRIFIYEDLPDDFLSKLVCYFHGFSFDRFFGNKDKTTFKTEDEWLEIFKGLDLKLVHDKYVSLSFEPVKKKLFVLEVLGA